MSVPVFRFAPSPNGFLHLGHAYSALLNSSLAAKYQGRFLLRIEDTDGSRARSEFVTAIFEDLAWIGLEWERPVRIQSEHFADYEASLAQLRKIGAIYPCFCSRRHVQANALAARDPDGQPLYGGTCRLLPRPVAERRIAGGDAHGWRLDMASLGDNAAAVWGDAMIAKRTVGSSYHVAVVTDDALQGITHVVRGRDIEPATPLHMLLQRLLGLPTPQYQHHDLIKGADGRKLSKSEGSTALRQLRSEGMAPSEIRQILGFP
ncbi:tRNA glutamyl-Q(34) synthetase GluQRS [Aestuariivirga sp.]|jgi:glutamyl-Q tRNA(Asp) synthetase|uniref:tRNA glutamyl-Q(34) synthetase GluQRS n=1 Tax=Aestuariivirga sp. TaxID=2650926 RepID=UPI0037846CD2